MSTTEIQNISWKEIKEGYILRYLSGTAVSLGLMSLINEIFKIVDTRDFYLCLIIVSLWVGLSVKSKAKRALTTKEIINLHLHLYPFMILLIITSKITIGAKLWLTVSEITVVMLILCIGEIIVNHEESKK